MFGDIAPRKAPKIKGSKFYAILYRLKYMRRWSLMHNLFEENVMEHSYMVAVISHTLAEMHNYIVDEYGRGVKLDVGDVVTCAMYHDCAEAITGDVPTPIKRYSTESMKVYGKTEEKAIQHMLGTLTGQMEIMRPILKRAMRYGKLKESSTQEDIDIRNLVKAADNISALIKQIEELRSGNEEFYEAYDDTIKTLHMLGKQYLEVSWFCDNCLDAFGHTRQDLGCGIKFQEGNYNTEVPLSEQYEETK